METGLISLEKLQNIVSNTFGDDYIIHNSERLLGGAQKHVYKVQCKNKFEFILYIWHKDTTYFEDTDEYGFTSNSAALFEENNTFMLRHGISIPKMYFMDKTKKEHEFEFAMVEFIDGVDFDYIIEKQPERLKPALKSLNDSIIKMHSIKRSQAGTISNPMHKSFSCIDYVFNGAEKV